MATQKKPAIVEELSPEMNRLKTAINSERSAQAGSQDSMSVKNAALRETALAAVALFAAVEAFTGADMVREYYAGSNTPPKGNALKSRTSNWNTVRDAARKNRQLVEAIWPTKAEAEKLEIRNTTRQAFMDGCSVIAANPSVDIGTVRAKMFASKASDFKVPDMAKANVGDLLATIVSAGFHLMNRDPATFKVYSAHLLEIQTEYNSQRADGELRTSEEIRKSPEPVPMMQAAA